MNTILLPIGSLLIAILLMIVYFSKRNINNSETKIYSVMLIVNFIYAVLAIITFIYAKTIGTEIIVAFLQKFYMISMIALIILIILYNAFLSKFKRKVIKSINIGVLLSFIIFSILIVITPLSVINYGDVIDGYGLSYDITLVATVFYLVLIVISTVYIFINNKNAFSKDIPFVVLIILYIIGLIIREYFPHVMFENFFFSFMLLIMYFTIENPDLKMLEEFHRTREYAENSNMEKSNFLFAMAKEVKEPILKINRISKNVLMQDDMELIKHNVSQIKYSSNNLLELVNKVLDINSIESRKVSVRESKYNPSNLFKGIISQTELKLKEKVVEFRPKYDETIPKELYGDSIRIRQIINTLLENAIKYTDEGFVELNVNSIIKHDICRLIITVEDSGRGMNQDIVEHILDKNINKIDKIDNAKMDLSLVKTLLDLIGGTVMVNSELNKGTKFTIVIDQKIVNAKSKTIEAVEKYEELYLNNKRVMLVINNEKLSKKLNTYLKKYPIEVVTESMGQSCLERIRNNEKFDLIIMEDNLEKLSHENSLRKLKDIQGFKTPVVLLTNLKEINEREEYLKLGFTEVVTLPLKKEQVSELAHTYKFEE